MNARILDDLRDKADDWSSVRNTIERAHAEYERHGYVISQGSLGRDVSGVAVPLYLADANAVYAFNLAGSSARMPLSLLRNQLGPSLKAMVEQVAQAMATFQQPQLVLNVNPD